MNDTVSAMISTTLDAEHPGSGRPFSAQALARSRGISDVTGILAGLAFLAGRAVILVGAVLFATVVSCAGVLLFAATRLVGHERG
jgi:hypothetical protein